MVIFTIIVLDLLIIFSMIKSYQMAERAHLNQGILMSVFSLLPIFMAVAFLIVFKEPLHLCQGLAIIFSITGIILIIFSRSKKESEIDEGFVHPIWSILLMIQTLIFMTMRSTVIKHEVRRLHDLHNTSAI